MGKLTGANSKVGAARAVRSPKHAADDIRKSLAGGDPTIAVGPSLYYFYDPTRTQRIVEATKVRWQLGSECNVGGARFLALRRALGRAAVALAGSMSPTVEVRVDRLKQIERVATTLRELMEQDTLGWNAWSEVRMSMADAQLEGGKPSAWDSSPIDPGLYPRIVDTVAQFAQSTHQRLAQGERQRADLTAFVAALATAYEKFFGQVARISTSADNKRTGPFVRFVQSAAGEIGLALTPEQIRGHWRKANRGRKANPQQ